MTEPPGPLAIWTAYNEASNAGDHDTAARYLDPSLAVLVNGRPALESVEQDRAVQQELIRCYPDWARSRDAGFETGEDLAVVEWTMRGTPAAGLDLPPLVVPGCSIVRCVAGRITEARLYHPTGALDVLTKRALAGLADPA